MLQYEQTQVAVSDILTRLQEYTTPDLGTVINALVGIVGSGNPAEFIVPAGNWTAKTLLTLGKGHVLKILGKGTFTCVGIRFTDSTTDTTGSGGIDCPDGATIRLANGANVDVISQVNFGTLTGTNSTFGVFNTFIRGASIDGNSANNSSGYGIRLFGRNFQLENVTIQNTAQDGLWTEGNQPSFTDATSQVESDIWRLHIVQAGGAGWTHKGPNDVVISHFVAWGCVTWGWDVYMSAHASHVNTYLNTSGGIRVSAAGSIIGSDIVGSTATGDGMLLDTNSGATIISSGTFGGPTGLHIKSPTHRISGLVANCTTQGVLLDGSSAMKVRLDVVVYNNSGTAQIVFSNSGGANTLIDVSGSLGAIPLTSGSVPGSTTIRSTAA